MWKSFVIAGAAALLAACASTGADKPPVCDGKHLRPANPYGSVLAPATDTAAPTAIKLGQRGADKPAPPTSGATFGSCGP